MCIYYAGMTELPLFLFSFSSFSHDMSQFKQSYVSKDVGKLYLISDTVLAYRSKCFSEVYQV